MWDFTFPTLLCRILFKLFHKCIYTLHLSENVNILWTMMDTLVATDAVTRLTQARHTPVITDEKCATRSAVLFALRRRGHIALIDTFVIMGKDSGYIKPVGALPPYTHPIGQKCVCCPENACSSVSVYPYVRIDCLPVLYPSERYARYGNVHSDFSPRCGETHHSRS